MWQRARRRLIICALSIVGVIALILVAEAAIYYPVSKRADSLLGVMRQVQVGKTTAADVIRMTDSFGGTRIFVDPGTRTEISKDECEQECTIDFRAIAPSWMGIPSSHYPQVAFLFPFTGITANLRVHAGIVRAQTVGMESYREGFPAVEAQVIIGDSPTGPPWTVGRYSGKVPEMGTLQFIHVMATTQAKPEQLAHAFDFGRYCLFPRPACSDCEMLPGACEEYERTHILIH
jgi:hypothetical protein